MLADRADQLDIASRPDLDLHPAIALGQMTLDGLEQFHDGRVKPHCQARLNTQADLLIDRPEHPG